MRPLIIAGPTASGKSALALAVARRDGGIVINADALQVYRCWRILSARPGDADLAAAPHALYGHVDCATRHSVGDWLRSLSPVLDGARSRGLRPIIVGGTGLYLTALTRGLAAIPPIDPAIRAEADRLTAEGRSAAMLADLDRLDPETAGRIDRANPARIRRAWEVLSATGHGLAYWHARPAAPLLPEAAAERVIVWPEKAFLHKAMADRLEAMLAAGALTECAANMPDWDPSRPSAQVLGAAPFIAHLQGRASLAEARAETLLRTRQYAKRQMTWLRNRMADWPRLDPSAIACIASQSPGNPLTKQVF